MEVTVAIKFASEAEAAAYLSGQSSAAPAASGSSKPSPSPAAAKSKNTREAMVAVMNKLKAESGADACRAILEKVCGKPTKMAEVPDDKIDAVFDGATQALAAALAAKDDTM